MAIPPRERLTVAMICAVQLINIIDFTMVMPLGPDFASALRIDPSDLGLVAGAYTLAAALAAVAGFYCLDRFARRPALVLAMLGLAVGTLGGALAVDLWSLLGMRALAGLFGGPATAIAMSMVIDAVPVERRGRAMGVVMGAFSIAAVIGVPASLGLSSWLGWRAPFIVVAALCALLALLAWRLLPRFDGHLASSARSRPNLLAALRQPRVRVALAMTAAAMVAGFLLLPPISPWVQFNLGYPREQLPLIYLGAGAVGFFALRLGGRASDRYGTLATGAGATAICLLLLLPTFVAPVSGAWVAPAFAALLIAITLRNASMVTTLTNVPAEHERAGFMSLNSAVQSAASALGGWLGSQLLDSADDGRLQGMPLLVALAALLLVSMPLCQWWLRRETGIAAGRAALGER